MEARILFNQHFAAQTEGVDEQKRAKRQRRRRRRGGGEGLLVGRVAAEELEGVLTRTAQSNITGRRCNAG